MSGAQHERGAKETVSGARYLQRVRRVRAAELQRASNLIYISPDRVRLC